MATTTISASELKFAYSSSWTAGAARQGVYSSTRYQGAMKFAGLSDLKYSNMSITQIQLKVTFTAAGGDSRKN